MKEALFYRKLKGKTVQCQLCPRFCVIKDGNVGTCSVRQNKGGKLNSLVYGKVVSFGVDPIEKKPLFHFAPGSTCVSVATVGCNLRCGFCQNYDVSMSEEIKGRDMEPEDIVEIAVSQGIPGIAYTYTEPTIFYEFALDTMKLAKKAKLYNVWVSNGYTNPEPIRKMGKYLDAVNIDMKGDVEFYQRMCEVSDERPIRKALKEYKKHKIWIEVTNMLIPEYNDREEQIRKLVTWVKNNLGVNTPIHFSRYHPMHKVKVPRTPVETLEHAHRIARGLGMKWVYLGNVWGHEYESTFCPKCGELLVRRIGFELGSFTDKCDCGQKLLYAGKKWRGIVDV